MTRRPHLLAGLAAISGLAGCVTQPVLVSAPVEMEMNNMLTIITSADAETQIMALVLTRSAMAAGETPRILLCSAGGDLALAAPPANALAPLQPTGASPQGVLKSLIGDGVRVDVCAIYLPNRPFGPEALIDEVGVAAPAEIGSDIARPGETILSF